MAQLKHHCLALCAKTCEVHETTGRPICHFRLPTATPIVSTKYPFVEGTAPFKNLNSEREPKGVRSWNMAMMAAN